MAFWRNHVVPRIVNRACGRPEFTAPRQRVLGGVRGEVVEIGFGSGHSLASYPPGVTRVWAVEPSSRARRFAADRVAAAGFPVEFVGIDGDRIELPDHCVDGAVSTFTLCSVPSPLQTLGELRRVLRPGGRLHSVEHGLSPDPAVARWQHRLTPVQRRLCGGCHFDRPIAELVTRAGFRIVELRNSQIPGMKTAGYLYELVAEPT
jgi:SAM-dependent methyltransferase